MNSKYALAVAAVLATTGCQSASSDHLSTHPAHVFRQENAAVNVNEWAAASQMLDRAAELIKERGFQQGSLVATSHECMATALEHAFREKDYSIVDFNYAREALSRTLEIERDPSPLADDLLAVPYWGRPLMDWNDKAGRTEGEVIQALKTAAGAAMEYRQQAIQAAKVASAKE